MKTGDRIKQARKLRGFTRTALSKMTGIPYSTLAGIEDGHQSGTTKIDLFAAALRVRSAWLGSNKGPMEEGGSDEDWPEVTGFAQSAALGDGMTPDEYAETHKLKFRADSLRRQGLHAENLAVYYGRGDSMEPNIRDGDAIMFDRSDTDLRDDAIFIVRYDGHEFAKRLQKLGEQWFMVSDNNNDPKWRRPKLIESHKHFEVIGRVRWIGRWEA